MSSGEAPSSQKASERLSEIAEILALGLIRLRSPKSSRLSTDSGEIPLDISPERSVHPDPYRPEK